MTDLPTVLLIEGGWSGPWVFAKLVAALAQRGVTALTLPPVTDGERTWRPAMRSAEAQERVRSAIQSIDGPVVLAAHSGGGIEMTWCGNEPHVEHLVYMSAFMPGSGVNLYSGPEEGSTVEDDEGYNFRVPELAGERYFTDLPTDEQEWAVSTLIPLAPAGTPAPRVAEPAFKTKPSSYIVFERDQALLPEGQEQLAAFTGQSYHVDGAHFAFMSQPDAVADILASIAKAT